MAFPTIPTTGNGRLAGVNQLNTTATLTGPNLTALTARAAGDLVIAIAGEYQSNAGADAAFTGWAGGGLTWTEIRDSTGTADCRLGVAYARLATGSETGTVTVTRSGTLVGDASMILMVIPGAHASTAPEATAVAVATAAAANPASLDPANWATEDTLWITVCGSGMTNAGGTWDGVTAAPANYGSFFETAASDTSTIGDFELAVAFRQNAASSEDAAGFTQDTSNTRSAGLTIAVRPLTVLAGLGVAQAQSAQNVLLTPGLLGLNVAQGQDIGSEGGAGSTPTVGATSHLAYAGSGVTTAAVPVPASAASGKVAILHLGFEKITTLPTSITPPSGFALISSVDQQTGNLRDTYWWKRLSGADSGTYDFSWTTASERTATCTLLDGTIATGDPYDTGFEHLSAPGTTSTDAPAVNCTTLGANRRLFYGALGIDGSNVWTPPTGFNEEIQQPNITAATKEQTSAGDTGQLTGSNTNTDEKLAFILAIKPPAGGGGPIDLVEESGSTNLVGLGVAQAQATADPSLVVDLNGLGVAQAQATADPSLIVNLNGLGVAQAQAATGPVISKNLAGLGVAQAQAATLTGLTQVHVLVNLGVAQAQAATGPLISRNLAGLNVAQGQSAQNVVLIPDPAERSLSNANNTTGTGSATSLAVTPTGQVIGDGMLAALLTMGGVETHSAPDGTWTQLGSTIAVSNTHYLSFWRKSITATGETYTFSWTTSRRAVLFVRAFYHVDPNDMLDGAVQGSGAAAQTSKTHPTHTPSAIGRRWILVTAKGTATSVPAGTVLNTPSGFTETADLTSTHATNTNANAGMHHKVVGTGATGTQVVDSPDASSQIWSGTSILIKSGQASGINLAGLGVAQAQSTLQRYAPGTFEDGYGEFEDVPLRIIQTSSLAGLNVAQAQAATLTGLTQVHTLAGLGVAQAHDTENVALAVTLANLGVAQAQATADPTLERIYNLLGLNVAQAQATVDPTLERIYNLLGLNVAQAQAATIARFTYILQGLNVAHPQAAQNVVLAAAGTLAGLNVAQGQTTTNIALTQVHVLIIAALDGNYHDPYGQPPTQGQSVQNVVLTQVHVLTGLGVAQAHAGTIARFTYILQGLNVAQAQATADPTLVQQHTLAGLNVAQVQSVPQIPLGTLLVNLGVAQAQATADPTLTQLHILAGLNVAQPQAATGPTLERIFNLLGLNVAQAQSATIARFVYNLLVTGVAQGQSAPNIALAQLHILAGLGTGQTQSVPQITLSAAGTLGGMNVAQAQSTLDPTLERMFNLLGLGVLQAQATADPVLGFGLMALGVTQPQTTTMLGLVQAHNLAGLGVLTPQQVTLIVLAVGALPLIRLTDGRVIQRYGDGRLVRQGGDGGRVVPRGMT